MHWIDKLNKELQERRERNNTPEAKEESQQRMKNWIVSNAAKISAINNKGKYLKAFSQNIENKKIFSDSGKKHIESGHLKKISSLGGIAHVKSGHLQKIKGLGGKVTQEKYSKPILAYDKITGEFFREFISVKEANRLNGWCPKKIKECCLGKRKTIYGYIWKYKDSL